MFTTNWQTSGLHIDGLAVLRLAVLRLAELTHYRTPNGIRTRAATLKGWCPRPLDDGGLGTRLDESVATLTGLPAVSTRRLAPAVVLHGGFYARGFCMRAEMALSRSHDKKL